MHVSRLHTLLGHANNTRHRIVRTHGYTTMNASQSPQNSIGIVWFRERDIRIHDHQPLHTSLLESKACTIPFFCLDDNLFRPHHASRLHTPTTGPFRLLAILKAIQHLDTSLQSLNSSLLTATGSTTQSINSLIDTLLASPSSASSSSQSSSLPIDHISLYYYTYRCNAFYTPSMIQHEDEVIHSFMSTVSSRGYSCTVHPCWGSTLYHPEDVLHVFSSHTHGTTTSITSITDQNNTLHTDNNNNNNINIQQQYNNKEQLDALTDTLYYNVLLPTMTDPSTTMTSFRSKLQTEATVRQPFQPPTTPLPTLPTCLDPFVLRKNSLLSRIYDNIDSIDVLYKNAGALDAYNQLQRLLGASLLVVDDSSSSNNNDDQKCYYYKDILSDDYNEYTSNAFITEKEALDRLDYILSQNSTITTNTNTNTMSSSSNSFIEQYKDTRMMARGASSTAMLSTALSLGTLSPRTIYWKVVNSMIKNDGEWNWKDPIDKKKEGDGDCYVDGCMWLLMHLGIRDFFLYHSSCCCIQHQPEIDNNNDEDNKMWWSDDMDVFSKWASGNTGIPFIDANMRQLASTGWMSNRGRQNVASFLSKTLKINWLLGAEYFQSLLIDHEFGVNIGNWMYIAGVGADPRDRKFKTVTQGEKYDENAELVSRFVKEVADVSNVEFKHRPWLLLLLGAENNNNELQLKEESQLREYCRSIIVDPADQIGVVKKKNR